VQHAFDANEPQSTRARGRRGLADRARTDLQTTSDRSGNPSPVPLELAKRSATIKRPRARSHDFVIEESDLGVGHANP